VALMISASIVYKQLGTNFSSTSESSTDGKWVASDMVTQNEQVCLLINLDERDVKCLTYEEGWYHSPIFLSDNTSIVYAYHKKVDSSYSIMFSSIETGESIELVSGLLRAWIIFSTGNEIVFSGRTYNNPSCSYLYIISQDGRDFRKLSYLGEQCLLDGNIEK